MKKQYAIVLLILILGATNTKADPKHFPSTISEVTVYLQGAMIKRTAQVALQPGTNEIVLDGLSNYLDINSVRLESSSSITILSVNAAINYLAPNETSSAEKQLQVSLDTLNLKLSRLRNEITALNNEMDMLKQNYKVSINDKGAYVDILENAADFCQKRMKDVLNDLSALGIREQDYTLKISATAAQINEITNKKKRPNGEITVTASSQAYGNADFTFTYYVGNAQWIPTYNMRAENTTSEVNLDYDAEVAQTTGEDWKNVKLILSTGNPSVNGEKPTMEVARLDYGSETIKRWKKINAPDNFGIRDKDSLGRDPNEPIEDDKSTNRRVYYASNYTKTNQNILATTFEINLKYEILSNGMAKHIRIQQHVLPAKFTYTALPKISTDAFLQANITGWEAYNLLPGEVNIFLDNGFVGKSYIDPSITKDTLSVSFGKDQKINIMRIRVKEFTKNQFLGANKIQSFGYATSIRNTKQVPVEILIEDQLPVSAQKDIVVELKESSGAQLDPATGKLSWTVTLQPNEEKALKFEYTVKYPKGRVVAGL